MVVCKFFLQGTCKFGNTCKFDHTLSDPYHYVNPNAGGGTSILRQPAAAYVKPNQTSAPIDTATLVKSVVNEAIAAEKGGQWPLTCYAPFKEKPAFPGLEDTSFEEVRLGFYEARDNGALDQYTRKIQEMLQTRMMQLKALQNPSPDIVKILQNIYDTPVNGANNFAGNAFPSPTANNTPFGGNSNKPFVQTTNSVFGGNSTSVFGGFPQNSQVGGSIFQNAAPQQSTFQPQPQQSIFGGQTTSPFGSAPQSNAFGGSPQNTASIFSPTPFGQTTNSIFGGNQPQPPQPQQSGIFGGNQPQPQPQQPSGIFGGNQTPQQASGIFGGNQNPQSTGGSIFGGNQPQPQTQSVFGQNFAQNQAQLAQPQNPYGGPQAFVQPPQNQPQAFAQSPLTQTTQSVFKPVFGGTPNVPASTFEVDASIYSKFEDLSPEEVDWFRRENFDVGSIPEKPPTYEMCHQ
ncbi:unnamed protein product [Brassicogethes aeneus]|uniref:Nucleoporin NUP42 n=1 Tax=Brassicogethes aeneus TaxID=1431903 RepID=A0A9P0FQD7_BRAAE|nr:unnamed protein product [Brassicogethes aeneus]